MGDFLYLWGISSNNIVIMKSFGPKPWILPQPVLIIGTYDKEGKPNAMNAAWGGQWDMHEIIISLGSHQTTDNLKESDDFTVAFATTETMVASDYVGIVSGRNTGQSIFPVHECAATPIPFRGGVGGGVSIILVYY